MAASKKDRASGDVPVTVLREVQALLLEGKCRAFLAPVERLRADMSWTVIGSKTSLGHFLFRLVFAQFRERKLNLQDAQFAVEVIAQHGGAVKDMDVAFKEELAHHATKDNLADLADQVAFARYLGEMGLLGRRSMKQWAGETLADALKDLCWSNFRGRRRRRNDKDALTIEIINALGELGAAPAAKPPRFHRERDTVAYYLADIGNPRLAHAFYSAWHAQQGESSKPAPKGKDLGRARPVSKKARRTVVKALREVGRDPDSGERVQTKRERENFQRILDCMSPRYLPVLDQRDPAREPWKGSVVGGEMFNSEKYPWPETKSYPDVPLVQLELDAITETTGINVGAGFLQVWRPLGFRTKGERSAALKLRVIPRDLVTRQRTHEPAPAKYVELSAHPDYSWRFSRSRGPKAVKGWKRFGFAVPNPALLSFDVLGSRLFPEETTAILKASVHHCALELFGFPQPARTLLRLPSDWRPLATIYGPTHRMKCGYSNSPLDDISQVYFRCVDANQFEYRCYSWRAFDPW